MRRQLDEAEEEISREKAHRRKVKKKNSLNHFLSVQMNSSKYTRVKTNLFHIGTERSRRLC